LARRRVDTVVTRPLDGRRGDAHVDLARARRPDHLVVCRAGGAAHDGVVNYYDALPRQHLAVGVELDLDPEVPDALARLDERPAHVVVADEPAVVRDPRLLRVAQSRAHAGVGHRDDEIGLYGVLAGELMPERLPHRVHVAPP